MNEHVLTALQDIKLPWKVKISFVCQNFARMVGSTLVSAYAVFYYTTVLGLNGALVGTIILISKIWDIINDPMMGAYCDRTKSKEGKCRFWIKYFSVPGGVILATMFIIPPLSSTGLYVWIAVTYVLQSMAHTVLGIPGNALMGRLTSNKEERAVLNQIGNFFALAGTYLAIGLTMPAVQMFGGDDMRKGFVAVAIIAGILYAVGFLICAAGTKGYEPLEHLAARRPDSAETVLKEEKESVWASVKAILPNTYWLLVFVLSFLFILTSGLEQTGMAQYYMHNLGNMELLALYSTVSLVASILGLFLIGVMVKWFGNAGSIVVGAIVAFAGLAMRMVVHDSVMAVWGIGVFLENFGGTFINGMLILCIFDSRVYGKWKTGVDNDAILMSGLTTSSKVGFAITSSLGAMLLSAVQYDPKMEVQPDQVLNLLSMENLLFPAVGMVITALMGLVIAKMEKKVPQMQAELAERGN